MRTRRSLFALATVVAIVGVAAWTQIGGSASGATSGQDKITYNQTTGANGTYILYTPASGGTTKQSVTSGGGCATPSPSGTPILNFSAAYWSAGYDNPTTPATPAVVGAYKSRTGVCQVPQAWSIERNEQLTFSIGNNSLVAGRLFTRAQIQLEREDKSTSTDPAVTGHLVMRTGSTVVGTVPFAIQGPNGSQITADTGVVAQGFDAVDIRVESPAAGSISVVGPTSTFYLSYKICGGQTIQTTSTDGTTSSGQITASFTLSAPSTTCKSYTSFTASAADSSISFLSQQVAGLHMTATFDWGLEPFCRADGSAPACPPTQVDFGGGFVDQPYCDAASHAVTQTPPWCTTEKVVSYVQDPNDPSKTLTHIVEQWDGYGDILYHR